MIAVVLDVILYIPHVLAAIWCVLKYIFTSLVLRRPVSFPGDPLKRPLTRRGNWPQDREQISIGRGWQFACDEASHSVSQKYAPGYAMTGESAGRQIWFQQQELQKKNHSVAAKKGKAQNGDDEDDEEEQPFLAAENPNSGDKVFRKIMINKWKGAVPNLRSRPATAEEAAHKALEFYQMIQCEDGHWAGDYGGPMFLMPGLICVMHITKAPFPAWRKAGMVAYLRNHQQVDGGWGTHIECASTMFGTVLSYVALRLLGEAPESEHMIAARDFIKSHGGALLAPSWAKFWLAVLGVYHWDGINSIPAEMWFLPRWFPFHPGKLWCHCRMVYLPMCYVYCKRFVPDVDNDPVLSALREELYLQPYDSIDWNASRQICADIDTYSPLQPVMKIAQDFLSVYERWLPIIYPLRWLREKALAFVISYIHAEDFQTNYVDIGPVNKALNMLSVWIDADMDNSAEAFQRHIPRIDDYLWVAEDGCKMQGYNGSQCWDTSFAVQAIVEGNLAVKFPECARKIYRYLDRTQIADDEENRELFYRHVSKGGWPFSTAAHGWPISDCTAEGLKGVLALHNAKNSGVIPLADRISDERLKDAVNVLLTLHNADGGWATYENNRGYGWYEMLNPSEVFGDIMIDYSYVECSSASITALKAFSEAIPEHRSAEVLNAIQAGRLFIKSIQRPDGSWYGSWGVCFTYGTWFGIEGLVAAGESTDSDPIVRATEFLLSKQNPNGGWGESYLACVNKSYPADGVGEFGEDGSGVVQTAWAILGLIAAECKDRIAIDRGVAFLMRKQLPSGDWEQEAITGVFNRSCGITYTAYRNVFPLWALSRYSNAYEKKSN